MAVNRVYLHIGAPKSGTSYLQQLLWANREPLAERGVLFPGERYKDQVLAAVDAMGGRYHGHRDPQAKGALARLAEPVVVWSGTSVISQEFLGSLTEKKIQALVEAFQPAEVRVLYTVRDLLRGLPSIWQTRLRIWHHDTFPEFLEKVAASTPEAGPLSNVWRNHDAVDVLRRWSSAVPAERIHVVTVPRAGSDPSLLWERVAGVLGVDPTCCDTTTGRANPSLGVTEAELLRRVNAGLDQRLPWPHYRRFVKAYLARKVLERRPGAVKTPVPPSAYGWITERSQAIVDGLRADGYDVVGDLEELLPALPADSAQTVSLSADDGQLLDSAVASVAGLLLRAAEQRHQLDQARRQLHRARRELAGAVGAAGAIGAAGAAQQRPGKRGRGAAVKGAGSAPPPLAPIRPARTGGPNGSGAATEADASLRERVVALGDRNVAVGMALAGYRRAKRLRGGRNASV